MTVEELSGLDAAFLALETPTAHMHVVGVAVLDPSDAPEPFTVEAVRRLVEGRIRLIPALRHRLVEVPFGLYVPVWIEDPDFDLTFHVRRASLAAPGGPAELAAFVGDVASRPLDRRKPLWEAYVVEGLEHGHRAFVAKLHHSLIDGSSGVEILASLFDTEPDAPVEPPATVDEWQPERVPNDVEMLGRAVASLARAPWRTFRAVRGLTRTVTRAIGRSRDEALRVTLPLTSPHLSINRPISAQRAVALTSVPLATVKATKNALGLTVNDVVLAVVAGAMRTYLTERDELPERGLVAAIPTSVRAPGDTSLGNKVSAMFAELPVEIADPIERVHRVAESTAGAKGFHEIIGGSTLQEWAELAAPALFSRAIRVYARLRVAERFRPVINVIVSNVPGPPFPLYLAGARLVALYPLGPIFDDCGLNITVLSYLDEIGFGLIGCQALVPDIDRITAAIPDALTALAKAAEAATASALDTRPPSP
ncbi:MAG: WS/DGAT/MGAT family O-acyltransferase [Acidimicrobiia bacterium]